MVHPPPNALLIESAVDGAANAPIGCRVDIDGCPIAGNVENEGDLDDEIGSVTCNCGDPQDDCRMCHRFELAELFAAPEDNTPECGSVDPGIGHHTRPAQPYPLVRLSSGVDDRVAEPVGIHNNGSERRESAPRQRLAAPDAPAEEYPHRLPQCLDARITRLYPCSVRDSWEIRFEWIQTVLVWVALVVGVGLSILETGVDPETVAASVAVTAYTIGMQAIPYRHKQLPLVSTLLAFLGVATALLAIGLTGGVESPYLLFLAVPIFFASAFHGMRLGGVTTLAAIVGLIGVAAASGEDLLSPPLPAIVAFYALLGITFGQAHRILIEEPRSGSASTQYGRLAAAHQLLSELAQLASSAELNPITIGRSALRDLAVNVPYAAGTIAIFDHDDQIVVATRGQPPPGTAAVDYGIELEGEDIGVLRLWPIPGASIDIDSPELQRSLQMVGLAFDNVLLLQSIARRGCGRNVFAWRGTSTTRLVRRLSRLDSGWTS